MYPNYIPGVWLVIWFSLASMQIMLGWMRWSCWQFHVFSFFHQTQKLAASISGRYPSHSYCPVRSRWNSLAIS
jgi:hypothetical protein